MAKMSRARGTPEAEEARSTQNYASALRRLYKRRQAIRTAAPFTAAVVAVAESWIYVNGTLCHMSERTLRVLDLHKSSGQEVIIDVRALLDEAVAASRGARKYKFQILHYAEGIVSCLYTHCRPVVESWLVVFNVREQRLLTTLGLDTTYKIFVRNDCDYLYFGTHSEFGNDGFRRWVLMGYDIEGDRWFEQKVHLLDMVGSDIGQSIAFEIIDGKFYGLSNQTSFEVDEVDWTSHYHCFRFPVAAPKPKTTERSVKDKMWRRQHAEGPIDDRWSFIRLIRDERDPKQLQVLESRKEWLAGSSGRRNYYTTKLVFPDKAADSDEREGSNSSSSSTSGTDPDPDPDANNVGGGIIINPATETIPEVRPHTSYDLPHSIPPARPRCPFTTHAGDDASTALMFTLSKCFIRSYHPASQTFLDLVDDPLTSTTATEHDSGPAAPRLRLRAGSRKLRPAMDILADPIARDPAQPHGRRAARLYEGGARNTITFWPPESPPDARTDPAVLAELHRVVNPPAHAGAVRGAWDERSLVYSTGTGGGMQALVFVSFDPGVHLQGLKEWGDECARRDSGYGTGLGEEGGSEAEGDGATLHWPAEPAGEEAGKGKGKQVPVSPVLDDVDDAVSSSPPQSVGYCPGWTPEASFDWPVEVTGAGDRCKGKGKVAGPARDAAASSDNGDDGGGNDGNGTERDAAAPLLDVGAGDSFSSAGQAYSSFSSFYSTADEGASGASSSQHPQPHEPAAAAAPPTTTSPALSGCKWARTETAMWREIALGFNGLPDFTSPNRRAGGDRSAV
ncbi:f-box domain containing protein [Diaporthe amygdali]|uniref:f-box domain containing protein n=1 Tax=Phomopsis amygdali TaxID=1214568 RepID=UPI0022FF2C5C|nr:f-box domain containing protein [Diaporthe amygdali]KAJ0119989.1 f-box domain containing protein [Diaporthe amygdali]